MRESRQHFLGVLTVLLFLVVLVSGYVLVRQNTTVTEAYMITNVPQAVFYVEQFNVQQKRYKIHCIYEKDLDQLNEKEIKNRYPSIIFGSRILSKKVLSLLDDISYLFSTLSINRRSFYEGLLDAGYYKNRQLLLPVSFNIPAAITLKAPNSEDAAGSVLQYSAMRSAGNEYTVNEKNTYVTMGFHPVWSDAALYGLLKAFDVSFSEEKSITWDRTRLDEASRYIKLWYSDASVSMKDTVNFNEQYRQIPPDLRVNLKKTQAWVFSSLDFFALDDSRRSGLQFAWMARDSVIPADDDAVFLGILSNGRAKDAGDAFIKWFFRYDTQSRLLEQSKLFRLDEICFGIAGGFSALSDVTEKLYPLYYRELLGKAPPRNMVILEGVRPSSWDDAKTGILLPILREWLTSDASFDLNDRLASELSAWHKRQSAGP